MTPAEQVAERAARIAGFRQLADVLERHPELPLPYEGAGVGSQSITFHFLGFDDGEKEAMAAAVRALPCRLTKAASGVDGEYFNLAGQLAGLHVRLVAFRQTVCERVVVGVETVTRSVPDPNVEVPTVEVVEQVERVEWRCSPVLAGGGS